MWTGQNIELNFFTLTVKMDGNFHHYTTLLTKQEPQVCYSDDVTSSLVTKITEPLTKDVSEGPADTLAIACFIQTAKLAEKISSDESEVFYGRTICQ